MIIERLRNLKKGESFVYYQGKTPQAHDKNGAFTEAGRLAHAGRIYLVQKLVKRVPDFCVNGAGTGEFQYIAVGK